MKGSNLHAAAQPMLGGKYKDRDTGVYEVRQNKNRDTGGVRTETQGGLR